MGLLNMLFGFRWSLYIVRNENELVYVMHENSVIRILGYVMGNYRDGAAPVPPWSLNLNFNKEHKSIHLRPDHFVNGDGISDELMNEIRAIDPGYMVPGGEPVFAEAKSKKRLKISDRPLNMDPEKTLQYYQELLADAGKKQKPKDPTFYDVIKEVFGQ